MISATFTECYHIPYMPGYLLHHHYIIFTLLYADFLPSANIWLFGFECFDNKYGAVRFFVVLSVEFLTFPLITGHTLLFHNYFEWIMWLCNGVLYSLLFCVVCQNNCCPSVMNTNVYVLYIRFLYNFRGIFIFTFNFFFLIGNC